MSMHPSENIDAAKEAMMNEGSPARARANRMRGHHIDMERAARNAGQEVRNMLGAAGCEIKELSGIVKGKIRRKPLGMVATAAITGVLAGMIYRRH